MSPKLTKEVLKLSLWFDKYGEDPDLRAKSAVEGYVRFYGNYLGSGRVVDNGMDNKRLRVLRDARWPGSRLKNPPEDGHKMICPSCKSGNYFEVYRGWNWRCTRCRDKGYISVTSGTRLDRMQLDFGKLLVLTYLFANHPAERLSYRHLTKIVGLSKDSARRWLKLMYIGDSAKPRVMSPKVIRIMNKSDSTEKRFRYLLRMLLDPDAVQAKPIEDGPSQG